MSQKRFKVVAPPESKEGVAISLDGPQRINLDSVVRQGARIRSEVERAVVRQLREKIFPAALKKCYELPNGRGYDVLIRDLVAEEIALDGAERCALRDALAQFQQQYGWVDDDADFFFALQKQLEPKDKE